MASEEVLRTHLQELRRGTVVVASLIALRRPGYGYALLQGLEEKNFSVEPGSLYPLLRRLEAQGVLESQWDTSEARPRKYYVLSALGQALYERLKAEWKGLNERVNALL